MSFLIKKNRFYFKKSLKLKFNHCNHYSNKSTLYVRTNLYKPLMNEKKK